MLVVATGGATVAQHSRPRSRGQDNPPSNPGDTVIRINAYPGSSGSFPQVIRVSSSSEQCCPSRKVHRNLRPITCSVIMNTNKRANIGRDKLTPWGRCKLPKEGSGMLGLEAWSRSLGANLQRSFSRSRSRRFGLGLELSLKSNI